MGRDPDWTFPDNSLNIQLYYPDHLHLIENGNIKFSKLIIKTFFLTQVKPSFSSNTFPIIFISSQSLSAVATPFNPKCKNFSLKFPTAPPKFQTLPASPPLPQVFSLPLKTTSDHMSSTEPTKLITSPTSLSFHLKLRIHLN